MTKKWFGWRLGLGSAGFVVAAAAVLLGAPSASAVSGAINTTDDPLTNPCLHGPTPSVNCNLYGAKGDVWLSGSPIEASLGDGTYIFAVLDPGGQKNPNDGISGNLSSPDGPAAQREFSISAGTITNLGNHQLDTDTNKLQLIPYEDTVNPGGVYILGVCQISKDTNTTPIAVTAVKPSDCKYDAFKVNSSATQIANGPTITKDAAGAFTDTFAWTIKKDVDHTTITSSSGSATFNYTVSVSHDGGTISGVTVTGTIQVFNPNLDQSNNTVPLTIDSVTDKLSDGTVCAVTGGGSQVLVDLETDFQYACSLSSLPQGELDNTATVSWSVQTIDGLLLAGGSADFTFTKISFAGSNVDDCVNVTDTLGGVLGKVCSTDASPTTFLYSHTVTGTPGTCVTQDNTATFTTNTTAITGSASQSVQLCTPVDLVVSKTANTSFTRTYNWGVSKSADKTRVDQLSGSVKFTYTVVAGQTGITDSSIQAAGTITITNPNDFEDITLTGVTDLVDNAGSCSITGSTTQTVKHGIPITLSYVCTYTSVPADGTNTATASWDKTAANTPDGSKSGFAAVSFGAPTISVNKTITPTDAFNGGGGVNLCTLTVAVTPCTLTGADATPFTTQTYVYSRNIAVVPNQCVTYPNTAATGTGQTSNASVTVCGPVAGGLTMGFWQNKNGQGIITGGASTAGVCNSGTWLQNYAPFQDLSATASCSGVATYVYNVIKAANSSGSSMNAMLKAQMLATALDVYFSDPALGGNKINAPAPIGGIKVDLAKICNMLDSGGAGTCSGAFTNTSSAFGGGTCQTVSALLSYAAGQSNAGGSMWYLNVKSTQQLAKNTFDAINNQQAFTC